MAAKLFGEPSHGETRGLFLPMGESENSGDLLSCSKPSQFQTPGEPKSLESGGNRHLLDSFSGSPGAEMRDKLASFFSSCRLDGIVTSISGSSANRDR